jgi:hypothetical protein
MTRDQAEGRKLQINRGMELMLRKTKKKEEPNFFNFAYAKMVSLFNVEFHFHIGIQLRKRNSQETKQ